MTPSRPHTLKIDVPTLIVHGDDDQIVPIGAAALPSSGWFRT
jgi:pimeloyl-ACP methyl ester carboxylesterase